MTVARHVSLGLRVPLSYSSVKKIVGAVLRAEKRKSYSDINVIFVDRKTIRRLNKKFLDTAGDTDVIAFPYEKMSGDIYICAPVAEENAKRFGEPLKREFLRLVVHGTLHLLGYADDPKREQLKMWKVQEPLVKRLYKTV